MASRGIHHKPAHRVKVSWADDDGKRQADLWVHMCNKCGSTIV